MMELCGRFQSAILTITAISVCKLASSVEESPSLNLNLFFFVCVSKVKRKIGKEKDS